MTYYRTAAILATAGAAATHVMYEIRKYGLENAWSKSIARKGSFTNPVAKLYSSLVHFYSIWGEAKAREHGDLSDEEKRQQMSDWHSFFYEMTGEVNSPELKQLVYHKRFMNNDLLNKMFEEREKKEPGSEEALIISMDELQRHNTPDDLWIAIEGNVYDLTEFAALHPGGPTIIKRFAGRDCTDAFLKIKHSPSAVTLSNKLIIGKLSTTRATIEQSSNVRLNARL